MSSRVERSPLIQLPSLQRSSENISERNDSCEVLIREEEEEDLGRGIQVFPPIGILKRKVNKTNVDKIKFQQNPALLSSQTSPLKDKKLTDFMNFCKKENIAFSTGERLYYDVNQTKNNHKKWSKIMNKAFENFSKDDAEIFISQLQAADNSKIAGEIFQSFVSKKPNKHVSIYDLTKSP
jgi:hypothetical protein